MTPFVEVINGVFSQIKHWVKMATIIIAYIDTYPPTH
jgi:hypothetical protein